MQKLRVLTVLLFVSIAMTFGACAEDETLNEVENAIEAPYDGDEEDPDKGGMTYNGGDEEDPDKGGM